MMVLYVSLSSEKDEGKNDGTWCSSRDGVHIGDTLMPHVVLHNDGSTLFAVGKNLSFVICFSSYVC